jgi:EAL domain-containing protein (putative c-di-GMP-specific phosphodiesterase class I)/ActR/RegA family two-component response regulator
LIRGNQPETVESQLVLLLDDDATVTEGLAAGLERQGRTIITCNDLESAQLIVEKIKPSHIVSDVRLTGQFGFEGLEFIRYARKYSPESQIILMTGDPSEALQLEASERGAVAFLSKPFEVRQRESILYLMACSALTASASDAMPLIRMPLLDEIVGSESLSPFFQPVVELKAGNRVLGYEALARYHDNYLLRDPQVLFQYAIRKQRVLDLELACVSKALRTGAQLTRNTILFMNIHPEVFSHGRELCDRLLRDTKRYDVDPRRIVLEITEQGSLKDDHSVFEAVERLRELGLRFALDDVGVAYSHLPFIDKLRPSFLKISQHFGTSFETDPTKMKIVSNLQSLASDFDCDLILEGIEDLATAEVATLMGIPYGQGFLFRHPAEASDLMGKGVQKMHS